MEIIIPQYVAAKYYLKDDGIFPNNKVLPVILYKTVLDLPYLGAASAIAELFSYNNWKNSWKDTVYNCHHYHSNTHEVLGVYKGSTHVQLGGENGEIVLLEKGDVLIIPAGVAHKNLEPKSRFKCVGAYPKGKHYDMLFGRDGERPMADHFIEKVPVPAQDPVFGYKPAELQKQWSN